MKTFLLFLVFFFIGFAIILSYQYWNPQKLPIGIIKPAITTQFSLKNAPIESLQGKIATISGTVNWLSRIASKPVHPKLLQSVQQGEEISTGANGKTVINIQNEASLFLQSNTHVGIVQLLPQNFVFVQDKGWVRYANTIKVPVSVKSFDLVTLLTSGIMTSTVDEKNQTVTIAVVKGNVHEAYEDSQNNSNVLMVNSGQTFVFDEVNKVGTIQ